MLTVWVLCRRFPDKLDPEPRPPRCQTSNDFTLSFISIEKVADSNSGISRVIDAPDKSSTAAPNNKIIVFVGTSPFLFSVSTSD